MIDRHPLVVYGLIRMKNNRFKTDFCTKFTEQILIQPNRNRAVCYLIILVKDDASRSFQKLVLLFGLGKIHDFLYLKTFIFQLFYDVHSALISSVRCEHRIENYPSLWAETHPVIWKNRIWRMWLQSVFNHDNIDSMRTKFFRKSIKFSQSFQLSIFVLGIDLEIVVLGSLGIIAKRHRLYHKNGVGCLHFLYFFIPLPAAW